MLRRALLALTVVFHGSISLAAEPDKVKPPPLRFMLHGNMSTELPSEEYLRFVERIKPDILVMGVFDQRLYSSAHPPADKKPKEPTPAPGELLKKWKTVAERLHKSGIRLVGQMELDCLTDRPADREQGTGFFGYYDRGWDERLLGARPTKKAVELLEEPDLDRHDVKDPKQDTLAKCGCRVNTKALNACINKPAWRSVQKAMVKAAIEHGVDGFITNRNYVDHCACSHCSAKLRRWLESRFTADQLRERFGIDDLAKHPLCMVGMHRDPTTVPSALALEKQRFAKHMVKEFFDEVYVEQGRSLKPDLVVAQWNHMAFFDELHLDRGHLPPSTRTSLAHGAADEKWGLPLDLWGKHESFFWYCNWGTSQNTILDKEYAGDTVLYGKYLRSLAAGKPYVINKYDFYRPRNMMAEAAALGYLTNALATPWQHEEDREVMTRYFDFFKKHADCHPAESLAEVALVFPRRALHAGDASPLEYVEAAGRTVVRQHILFDFLPDEGLTLETMKKYRALVLSGAEFLQEKERQALDQYVEAGGKVVVLTVARADRERAGACLEAARKLADAARPLPASFLRIENTRSDRDAFWKEFSAKVAGLSRFEAPWTVAVHAYRQPEKKRILLHLVNYNHDEKAKGASVSAREAPIAAEPVKALVRLPVGFTAERIQFHSPDDERVHVVPFTVDNGVINFETPKFLVYGLCAIERK